MNREERKMFAEEWGKVNLSCFIFFLRSPRPSQQLFYPLKFNKKSVSRGKKLVNWLNICN